MNRAETTNGPIAASPPPEVFDILEAIDDTLLVLDRDWRFTYLNREALKHADKPLEHLLGRTLWEIYPQVVGTEMETYYRKAVAEQTPVHFETRGLLTGRWLELHAYPCPQGLIVYGRDISQRKLAELALRQSEERFKHFMDNGPALAWIKDGQGRFVYINRRHEQRYGRTLEVLRGLSHFDIWPPEVARVFDEADQAVRSAGKTMEFIEMAPDPDGRPHFWQVFKFPFPDPEGGHYVGGMAVDVTERIQNEEKVREYSQQLQALSRRLLEVQEEERRHLACELHDEVGQALTALHMTLGAGRRLPPSEMHGCLEQAEVMVQNLTALVRHLSLRLRPTVLDDFGLVQALLAHIDRYQDQTGIRVGLRHEGLERRFAPAVETAAYRIIQEALTNVARHAQVKEATVRARRHGDSLVLHISDRGVGFDQERVRVARNTSGLSGMQERAALLEGRLTIDSAPGTGTCITAELPINSGGHPSAGVR